MKPDSYEAAFYEDHAEFVSRDRSLATMLEVVVSSEDDAEVRRVSITNLGARARDIQVTSYAELSLAPQAADVAHPAFSNLFVETEFVPDVGAILATRRKRSDDEIASLGCARACSWKARPSANCNLKPIARDSWDVVTISATLSRLSMAGRSRVRLVLCSIR